MDVFFTSQEALFVILRIAAILVATFVVAKVFKLATKKRFRSRLNLRLLFNIVSVIIYIAGAFLTVAQIPGVNVTFETVLAGSGIAALAISLGAQESLGNVINGIVMSSSRPFEVGDRIRLVGGDITGWVEDINIRHTVVRTFLNSRIIIPNSVINKDMIENSSFVEARASGFLDLIITHNSDMKRAMEIMEKAIWEHPNTIDTRTDLTAPKVPVSVRALSIWGVELRASVWTETVDNNFSTCSDIRIVIKQEFKDAGIEFASAIAASAPPA